MVFRRMRSIWHKKRLVEKSNCSNIFLLVFILILVGCSADEKQINISGTIREQDNFDLSKSELQLIPLAEGEKLKVSNFLYRFEEGQLMELMYPSENPAISLNLNTKFSYLMEKLIPGRYILAVHHLKPKYTTITQGSGPMYFARPLATENEKFIVIEVSKEILPPFQIILGNVIIPLINGNNVILSDFSDHNIMKY